MSRWISSWRMGRGGGGVLVWLLCLWALPPARCEAPAGASAAFDAYVSKLESRLAKDHWPSASFQDSAEDKNARLRRGDLIIERLTPAGEAELPGALLHHWRGTTFVRGASAADFERLMKNFTDYPQYFSPQVMRAEFLAPRDGRSPNHFGAMMRVRQHHVITVVMDTTYDVTFGKLDAQHGYSVSRSTHIDEVSSPGTKHEHALSGSEEHGFLWRLNTYWSYEERDGGLYMRVESVSLTRAIPTGLGWVVRPYVESVPRESLEFTLRAVCNALRK